MNHMLVLGHRILRFDEIESTNTYLLNEPKLLEQHGVVVTAKTQTAGRGRLGREYVSLPTQHLTFSIVVHPHRFTSSPGILSLLTGLAVSDALEEEYQLSSELKWPNDVLIQEDKVAGILIESSTPLSLKYPSYVVGIGINTHGKKTDFPKGLRAKLCTLEEVTAKPIDSETLFQSILLHYQNRLTELQHHSSQHIAQAWKERSHSIGKIILYDDAGTSKKGTIAGVTDEGFLKIQNASGDVIQYASGEVQYVKS